MHGRLRVAGLVVVAAALVAGSSGAASAGEMRLLSSEGPTWAGVMGASESGERVVIAGTAGPIGAGELNADSGIWSVRAADGATVRVSPQASLDPRGGGRVFQTSRGIQLPDGAWVGWRQQRSIDLDPSRTSSAYVRRVEPLGPVVGLKRPAGAKYRGEIEPTSVTASGAVTVVLDAFPVGPIVLHANAGQTALRPLRDPLTSPRNHSRGAWVRSPGGRVVAICRPEVVGLPKPTPGLTVYDARTPDVKVRSVRARRTGSNVTNCQASDSGVAVSVDSRRGRGYALVASVARARRFDTGRYTELGGISPGGETAVVFDRTGRAWGCSTSSPARSPRWSGAPALRARPNGSRGVRMDVT